MVAAALEQPFCPRGAESAALFANCQRAIACVQESYHVNVGYWYAVFHPSSETPAAAVIERGVRLRHHLVNDGAPLVANQSKAEQEAQVDSRCRALIWRRLAIWEAPARVEPARRGKDVAEYVILGEDALHPKPVRIRPVPTEPPPELPAQRATSLG